MRYLSDFTFLFAKLDCTHCVIHFTSIPLTQGKDCIFKQIIYFSAFFPCTPEVFLELQGTCSLGSDGRIHAGTSSFAPFTCCTFKASHAVTVNGDMEHVHSLVLLRSGSLTGWMSCRKPEEEERIKSTVMWWVLRLIFFLIAN